MKRNWFSIKNLGPTQAEILIYDTIGKGCECECEECDCGVGAKDFAEQMAEIPESQDILIRINSPGGSITDGLAIYNTINRRKDRVECIVDGFALSAASFIAIAGRKLSMPENAILMIHNPMGVACGDSREMAKMASVLDTCKSSIVSIYRDKTGKSDAEISAALDAETWFNGAEAKAWGLCDEVVPSVVLNNSFDLSNFKNAPKLSGDPSRLTPIIAPEPSPANGSPVSISAATEVGETGNAASTSTQNQGKIMNEPTPQAATTPPVSNVVVLSPDSIVALTNALTQTQSTLPGAAPVTAYSRIEVVGDAYDQMLNMKPGTDRLNHIRNAWADIQSAAISRKVMNVNTVASALTTNLLSDTVLTAIGNRLAPLGALFTQVMKDPVKPKAKIEVPLVSSAATPQTNPTDWESGNVTVDAVEVTMNEYSQSFSVTNAELQGGTQIAWMAQKNAIAFADKLIDIMVTPITVANYGAAALVAAAPAFGVSDLATLWAAGKNFTLRNLVLDGAYFARIMPTNTLGYQVNQGAPAFGFDGVWYSNRWSSAGANVVGFVASPEAMVIAAGLPIEPPGFNSPFASVGVATIPGVNLQVQTSTWVKPGTRVQWSAFDIVLGAAKADANALQIVTSS